MVFWVVTPYGDMVRYWGFRGPPSFNGHLSLFYPLALPLPVLCVVAWSSTLSHSFSYPSWPWWREAPCSCMHHYLAPKRVAIQASKDYATPACMYLQLPGLVHHLAPLPPPVSLPFFTSHWFTQILPPLHFHAPFSSPIHLTLKMEAARSPKTSVSYNFTAQC
jgi:hypothetical protein